MVLVRVAAVCASAAALGCSPQSLDQLVVMEEETDSGPPRPGQSPDYRTEHLRIFNALGGPVCRGLRDALEADAVALADRMELPILDPLEIHLGEDAVDDLCEIVEAPEGYTPYGCTFGTGSYTTMAARPSTESHELVHGIRRQHGLRGPPLFAEGLAMSLGNEGPRRDYYELWTNAKTQIEGPAQLYGLSDYETFLPEHYQRAGHFVFYLMDRFPDSAFEFFNDPALESRSIPRELFEAHFGITIEEADAQWREQAPIFYADGDPCPVMVPWQDGQIELSGTLDCGSPSTIGHGGGQWRTPPVCFELDVAQDIVFEFDVPTEGNAVGLQSLDCNNADNAISAPGRTTMLEACTWRLQVFIDDVGRPSYDYSLRMTKTQ